MLNDECSELRKQNLSHERTSEVQAAQIEMFRQDVANANSRCSVMQTQQSQMKAQWTAEKSELEGKVFQTLALQQSTLGTLRKKEKDFDSLQTQLSRVNKDAGKGQKSSIVVSKPLPRSWSSKVSNPSLRDAEISALQSTVLAANEEVSFLRMSIRDLAQRERGENTEALEAEVAALKQTLLEREGTVARLEIALQELEKQSAQEKSQLVARLGYAV